MDCIVCSCHFCVFTAVVWTQVLRSSFQTPGCGAANVVQVECYLHMKCAKGSAWEPNELSAVSTVPLASSSAQNGILGYLSLTVLTPN